MSTHTVTAEAYARAERMLVDSRPRLALRTSVRPAWLDGGSRFWYRVEVEHGAEFVLADPSSGTREPAFDHVRLAAGLRRASGHPVDAANLPFRGIALAAGAVIFEAFGYRWTCGLADYTCAASPSPARPPRSRSPRPTASGSPSGAARPSCSVDAHGRLEVQLTPTARPAYADAIPGLVAEPGPAGDARRG